MKFKLLTALLLTATSTSAFAIEESNALAEWNTPNTTAMVSGMLLDIAPKVSPRIVENAAWDTYMNIHVECKDKNFNAMSEWITLYSRSYNMIATQSNEYMIFEGKDSAGRIQLQCGNFGSITIGVLDMPHVMHQSSVKPIVEPIATIVVEPVDTIVVEPVVEPVVDAIATVEAAQPQSSEQK